MFHPLEWLSITGGFGMHRQDSPSKMIKRQIHGNNSFDVSIRQVLGLKRNLYAVIPDIISVKVPKPKVPKPKDPFPLRRLPSCKNLLPPNSSSKT